MDEGEGSRGTAEPVTERARIAGVEAGIAAGLVPSADALGAPWNRAGRSPLRAVKRDWRGGHALLLRAARLD